MLPHKKLVISFPGGAGGRWLCNLIYKLEKNLSLNEDKLVVNFHHSPYGNTAEADHFPFEKENLTYTYQHRTYFNGTCSFNIFLNLIHKHYLPEKILERPLQEVEKFVRYIKQPPCFLTNFPNSNVNIMFQEAQNKLFFPPATDITYDLLFTDQDQFIHKLFELLDRLGFEYTKNVELCKKSIDQYVRSCIDPASCFEDYNSPIWLSWGLAIASNMLDRRDLLSQNFKSLDQIKEYLLKYKQELKSITESKTLYKG